MKKTAFIFAFLLIVVSVVGQPAKTVELPSLASQKSIVRQLPNFYTLLYTETVENGRTEGQLSLVEAYSTPAHVHTIQLPSGLSVNDMYVCAEKDTVWIAGQDNNEGCGFLARFQAIDLFYASSPSIEFFRVPPFSMVSLETDRVRLVEFDKVRPFWDDSLKVDHVVFVGDMVRETMQWDGSYLPDDTLSVFLELQPRTLYVDCLFDEAVETYYDAAVVTQDFAVAVSRRMNQQGQLQPSLRVFTKRGFSLGYQPQREVVLTPSSANFEPNCGRLLTAEMGGNRMAFANTSTCGWDAGHLHVSAFDIALVNYPGIAYYPTTPNCLLYSDCDEFDEGSSFDLSSLKCRKTLEVPHLFYATIMDIRQVNTLAQHQLWQPKVQKGSIEIIKNQQ